MIRWAGVQPAVLGVQVEIVKRVFVQGPVVKVIGTPRRGEFIPRAELYSLR